MQVKWQLLLFLALFVEGFINWLKVEYRKTWNMIALGFGIVLAVVADINVLAMMNIAESSNDVVQIGLKIIGWLIAGVAIARGTNYIHDLMKRTTT